MHETNAKNKSPQKPSLGDYYAVSVRWDTTKNNEGFCLSDLRLRAITNHTHYSFRPFGLFLW